MKKTLFSILTIIFLSSCSLFTKNTPEQTPTLPNISTNQELEIQTGTIENETNSGGVNNSELPPTPLIEEGKNQSGEGHNSKLTQTTNNTQKPQKATKFPTDYTISTERITYDPEEGMSFGPTDIITIDLGDYKAQTQINGGCGGKTYSQVITNKSGQKVDKLPYSDIPEKIKIGNVEYKYDTDNLQFPDKIIRVYNGNEQNANLVNIPLKDATNISVETLRNSFKSGIIGGGDAYLPEIVNIKFDEFPIYFSYKKATNTPISFKIVKLTPDEEKLIQNDGKVLNIDFTDKLISRYTNGVSARIEGFTNSENRKYTIEIEETAKLDLMPLDNGEFKYTTEDGGKIFEKMVLEESDLPIIKLYKLDDNGYYSMSFVEPYKYVSYAEMCKPAIYVYTSTPQNQSVEIKPTNALSYFTKTIPNFDNENTWNYTTNPKKGNIIGNDKNTYDYLYYSIKVPNYEFNTDGWQVKGSDIKAFFQDKLDKIGFNKKEKNDFIEYWLELYDSESAYYFVSFKYNEKIDEYVKLNFNQKPNSQFRVLLESYKLPKNFENDYFKYENVGDKFDKYLIKKAERNSSFDVFEWGGVFYREKDGFVIY